jgi:hypothetical protein
MMMKRAILGLASMLVVFAALFAVIALRPLPKVKAHYGCSNASLKGNYGLTGSGFFGSASPFSPSSMVGLVTFDGHGNLSGDVNLVGGGHIYGEANFSGVTYTVSPTCTITTGEIDLYGTEVTLKGAVVDVIGGSEVLTDMEAPNTQNTTLTLDLKKVQGWD